MALHTIIIDDDPISVFLLSKMIDNIEAFHDLRAFDNGFAAIKHLRKSYNEEDKFAVFLDINMPEMDGWEFLERLESFALPENTPVIIVTSSIDKRDEVRAFQSKYVTNFLTKPIFVDQLSALGKQINP